MRVCPQDFIRVVLSTGVCLKLGFLYSCFLSSFKTPLLLREFYGGNFHFSDSLSQSHLESRIWLLSTFSCCRIINKKKSQRLFLAAPSFNKIFPACFFSFNDNAQISAKLSFSHLSFGIIDLPYLSWFKTETKAVRFFLPENLSYTLLPMSDYWWWWLSLLASGEALSRNVDFCWVNFTSSFLVPAAGTLFLH